MPFHPRRRRVIRKRRVARRPLRRRGAGPFRRSGKSLIAKPMGQYGTVTETISPSVGDLDGNSAYGWNMLLSSFPRSQAITAFYQFYRLKYIKFQYIPKYPLGTQITATDATTIGRPMRFYYMMNRQGTEPVSLTLQNFEEKGCKPIPFGDSRSRAVVIKYKPSLIQSLVSDGADTTTLQGTAAEPVFNKWVNRYYTQGGTSGVDVDNVNVQYHGHLNWIDDFNNTPAQTPVSEVRVTAVWEYKNPYMAQTTPPEQGAPTVTYVK